ncbi:MAG: ATP12 family protein [Robiginitomaculum sp.]
MAKRFYKTVCVKEQENGYSILLDGRVLKTPGKCTLILAEKFRAKLVAQEWQVQGEEIRPETMPCTRLANVACELTPARRPELVDEFISYLTTDLLCYWAAEPLALVEKQDEEWQPLLDWASETFTLDLATTTGLEALTHNKASQSHAEKYANALGGLDLTLLLHLTACFGSSVLALCVMEGHKDVLGAYQISRLDEIFQISRWGEDPLTRERVATMEKELNALGKMIKVKRETTG